MLEKCIIEWAIEEFQDFEATLFVNIEARKDTRKSILIKQGLFVSSFLKLYFYKRSGLKPQNSLIDPSNVLPSTVS